MLVRERANLREEEDRACEFVKSHVGSVPSDGGVRIEEATIPVGTLVVEENAAPVDVDENPSSGRNFF